MMKFKGKTKTIVLILVIILLLAWSFPSYISKIWSRLGFKSSRPNIVLITIDTLRADKLGVYGFPANISPEIDELANNGVVFSRVIAQSSWTRPSIGSFLTSRYPRQLGLYEEKWDVLPEEFTTLAESLKSAGYTTIGVTANPNINKFFQFDQGFDAYVDSQVIFRWMKDEDGKEKATKKLHLKPAKEVFRHALDEVSKLPKNPCYLQINIMDVHEGRRVPASEADPDLQSYDSPGYLQKVREASRETGAFIKELRQRPGWENTLFIINSDHGEGLNDHEGIRGSKGHGFILYKSQVWVPMIFYHTNDKTLSGMKIDQTVRLLDLMPTVLEIAGAKAPEGMEGRSFKPLLEGQSLAQLTEPVFAESSRGKSDKMAAYSEDLIYLENYDGWKDLPPKELQNFEGNERGIFTDVSSQHPEEKANLEKALAEFKNKYPASNPSVPKQVPSDDDVQRLRSLGYLK
ncbi:MAG: sulfatase [SAR324 cluster bacterium]|uniref:Sulfatase n=1 Tax=SAR324 cluster bacterium TaxID=2024889 RepID=A0A7X9IKR7_9DELT|nr:sulfatase [SAR324 cluster bacterium]